MREINEIIIHCSATDWGHDIDADTIRDWHKARGWSDIGYHYVIRLNGDIQQGRELSKTGAHVKGRNTGSIGICLIGGKDGTHAYTPAQWDSLKMLLEWCEFKWPDARICGHNDFTDQKTCPNFDVHVWWSQVNG